MNRKVTNEPLLEIDHVLIGASDLEQGCQFITELCGEAPIYGGAHPGQGTCNALLALEGFSYVEVIAPDPEQPDRSPLSRYLSDVTEPALMWWVVRSRSLDTVSERLQRKGIEVSTQQPGRRVMPDGKEVSWKVLVGRSPVLGAVLPFFIEWGDMSVHPSCTAPVRGRLSSVRVRHPAARLLHDVLGKVCKTETASRKQLQVNLRIGGNDVQLDTPRTFPPCMSELL